MALPACMLWGGALSFRSWLLIPPSFSKEAMPPGLWVLLSSCCLSWSQPGRIERPLIDHTGEPRSTPPISWSLVYLYLRNPFCLVGCHSQRPQNLVCGLLWKSHSDTYHLTSWSRWPTSQILSVNPHIVSQLPCSMTNSGLQSKTNNNNKNSLCFTKCPEFYEEEKQYLLWKPAICGEKPNCLVLEINRYRCGKSRCNTVVLLTSPDALLASGSTE